MKIYTKTGDDGTTSIFSGERVRKTDLRIEAVGCVDELNSVLGVVLCQARQESSLLGVAELLEGIQHDLFSLGATLSLVSERDTSHIKVPRICSEHVLALEKHIDFVSDQLVTQKSFLLPNGTPTSCALHLARTVARRAERDVLRLQDEYSFDPAVLHYLNRLSDLLYVLARFANKEVVSEQQPIYKYMK